MTNTPDTSPEQWQRKGSITTYDLLDALKHNPLLIQAGADISKEAHDTLRALSAERDALKAELRHFKKEVVDTLGANEADALARAEAAGAELAEAVGVIKFCARLNVTVIEKGERARAFLARHQKEAGA